MTKTKLLKINSSVYALKRVRIGGKPFIKLLKRGKHCLVWDDFKKSSSCIQFGEVLTNKIKFKIDGISFFEFFKVGIFIGVRDNGYRKLMVFRIYYG